MINLTTKDGEPWMLHEKDIADIRQIEDEGCKDGCIVYFWDGETIEVVENKDEIMWTGANTTWTS